MDAAACRKDLVSNLKSPLKLNGLIDSTVREEQSGIAVYVAIDVNMGSLFFHIPESEESDIKSTFFYHQEFTYRSTIAGSFKNNSKNKKRKNYEIMKTKK